MAKSRSKIQVPRDMLWLTPVGRYKHAPDLTPFVRPGESQADMAKALGITRVQLSRWANGAAFPSADNKNYVDRLSGYLLEQMIDAVIAARRSMARFVPSDSAGRVRVRYGSGIDTNEQQKRAEMRQWLGPVAEMTAAIALYGPDIEANRAAWEQAFDIKSPDFDYLVDSDLNTDSDLIRGWGVGLILLMRSRRIELSSDAARFVAPHLALAGAEQLAGENVIRFKALRHDLTIALTSEELSQVARESWEALSCVRQVGQSIEKPNQGASTEANAPSKRARRK